MYVWWNLVRIKVYVDWLSQKPAFFVNPMSAFHEFDETETQDRHAKLQLLMGKWSPNLTVIILMIISTMIGPRLFEKEDSSYSSQSSKRSSEICGLNCK